MGGNVSDFKTQQEILLWLALKEGRVVEKYSPDGEPLGLTRSFRKGRLFERADTGPWLRSPMSLSDGFEFPTFWRKVKRTCKVRAEVWVQWSPFEDATVTDITQSRGEAEQWDVCTGPHTIEREIEEEEE